jgi:hypothetical protein
MNALSFELVEPLYAAIRAVAADNDTWVVVLTGAGRGFCSGLDLEDHGIPPGIDGLPMSRIAIRAMEYMSDLVPSLRAMPQPVIAAVNGPAYGGGMCLPLGADIRLAGVSARFRAAGITNGLTGTELGVSYLLPRTGRRVTRLRVDSLGARGSMPAKPSAAAWSRGSCRTTISCPPRSRSPRRCAATARTGCHDQEGAVVEPRGREPDRGDRPRESEPAAGPPDHAEPRGGDRARREKRRPRYQD